MGGIGYLSGFLAAGRAGAAHDLETNHSPTTIKDGSDTINHNIHTCTPRVGNNSIYPPSTPAMAPEAPRLGVTRLWLKYKVLNTWHNPAIMPHSR